MFTHATDSNVDVRRFLNNLIDLVIQSMLCSLIVFLALGPVGAAQAQSGEAPAETTRIAHADEASTAPNATEAPSAIGFKVTSATWRAHFDEQVAHVLNENDTSTSAENTVLRDVIVVTKLGSDQIDLTTALPELLRICKNDPSEARRLMALQALGTIGTEHAYNRLYGRTMQRLYDAMQDEPSARVRRAAAAVLMDFQENDH